MSKSGVVPNHRKYQHIAETIRDYIVAHGYPPSIRELAEINGSSKSNMKYHLGQLELYGYIERDKGITRGIRLLGGN